MSLYSLCRDNRSGKLRIICINNARKFEKQAAFLEVIERYPTYKTAEAKMKELRAQERKGGAMYGK